MKKTWKVKNTPAPCWSALRAQSCLQAVPVPTEVLNIAYMSKPTEEAWVVLKHLVSSSLVVPNMDCFCIFEVILTPNIIFCKCTLIQTGQQTKARVRAFQRVASC